MKPIRVYSKFPWVCPAEKTPDGDLACSQYFTLRDDGGETEDGFFELTGPDALTWKLCGPDDVGMPTYINPEYIVKATNGIAWCSASQGPYEYCEIEMANHDKVYLPYRFEQSLRAASPKMERGPE